MTDDEPINNLLFEILILSKHLPMQSAFLFFAICLSGPQPVLADQHHYPFYPWLATYDAQQALEKRIPTPTGFIRPVMPPNSFAAWLRQIPLKSGHPPVYLYNGQLKINQTAHVAVVNIDVGKRDLQQCADAVIRLRAEYLWSTNKIADIHFYFTNGDNAAYLEWTKGYRPKLSEKRVTWSRSGAVGNTYASFRKYLDIVFGYAGTLSLEKELKPVANFSDIQIGDVFIQGGSPGHAVLVIDVAENKKQQKKIFLLAQSYMPAQNIHILRNPGGSSPWYEVKKINTLVTPEWSFNIKALRRVP